MRALVLLLAVVGCAGLFDDRDTPTPAEMEARRQAAEHERQRQEARRQEEAVLDRMCLDPQTTYKQNWCIERQRQKDRAWAEQRQRAEWAHQERLQRQGMEFQDEQRRKTDDQRAFVPAPSVSCTTTTIGDSATTHCY